MKRLLTTTAIVCGALWFHPPSAGAVTISITDTWAVQAADYKSSGFITPTFSTSTTNTSNDGSITPTADGAAQTETIGTNGTNWLFAVIPGDTWPHASYGDIPVQFTLADGTGAQAGSVTFMAYVEYYANALTDKDFLLWSASPFTSPSNNYIASGATLVLNEILSNGSHITVNLPYETDWNMAQAVTYDVTAGPRAVAVPEPATIALLGLGLLGTLTVARRTRRC